MQFELTENAPRSGKDRRMDAGVTACFTPAEKVLKVPLKANKSLAASVVSHFALI